MRPGDRNYLAAADLLRVASIGLIAWYHIWQQSWLDPSFLAGGRYINLQSVVRHGYLMVDVVLVISGFLLILPYARAGRGLGPRPSLREYVLKRFWRIVPSYVLTVLLFLVLYALPEHQYDSPQFLAKDLFTHLTFTHNLSMDTYFSTPLQVVLWTMGVEVQFYLLFPLVVWLFERRPALTCLGLTLIAAAFRAWVYGQESTIFWVNQLPGMLDLYACGMAAGALYVRLSEQDFPPVLQWVLAGTALLAFLILMQMLYYGIVGDYEELRRQQLLYRLPIGLLSGACLLCGGLAPPALSRILGNPVTRFCSAISYNFYMWHTFVAMELKLLRIPPYTEEFPNMAGEQPWQGQYTLLCFLGAILIAAAVTYLWEKPVQRLGRKRTLPRSGL